MSALMTSPTTAFRTVFTCVCQTNVFCPCNHPKHSLDVLLTCECLLCMPNPIWNSMSTFGFWTISVAHFLNSSMSLAWCIWQCFDCQSIRIWLTRPKKNVPSSCCVWKQRRNPFNNIAFLVVLFLPLRLPHAEHCTATLSSPHSLLLLCLSNWKSHSKSFFCAPHLLLSLFLDLPSSHFKTDFLSEERAADLAPGTLKFFVEFFPR